VGVAIAAVGAYLASPLIVRPRAVEESPFPVAAALQQADAAIAAPSASGGGGTEPPARDASAAGPVGVRILGSGTFSDRDQVHRGSGQAILAQTPTGTTYLRFESFNVTNGPDLHVFLSRSDRPASSAEVHDGVYVGKLKAPEGAFHYELDPSADLAAIRSVVIYCVPFRVIFSSAPLAPAATRRDAEIELALMAHSDFAASADPVADPG
jgi:hypothetical protein